VSFPPPKTDQEQAEDKKKKIRKSVKFWVEILDVVVLMIYTGFTIAIFHSSKKAADAAMRANAIATNYLIQTEKANVGRETGWRSGLIRNAK
jgi:flagellar basal body-associated protein FliL